MPERRLRTVQRRKRARARFWDNHAEKVRLGLIGGGIVIVTALAAQMLLR